MGGGDGGLGPQRQSTIPFVSIVFACRFVDLKWKVVGLWCGHSRGIPGAFTESPGAVAPQGHDSRGLTVFLLQRLLCNANLNRPA